jgi:copper(I)-binding protein
MKLHHPRRQVLQAGLALGASLALPSARACEFFSTNLRITHPWTRATAEDASFAIVCMKFDDVRQADRLIGVETPVAGRAEMGGPGGGPAVDFFIPEGRETLLGETGTHLRLVDLKLRLQVAREYPLLLTFEKSGTVNATLNVDYTRFK